MKVVKVPPAMGKLREEIDRTFDRFFPVRLLDEPLLFPFDRTSMELGWMPAFDLVENEKEYIVRLEVPGMHKENLDIGLTGDLLTITGTREIKKEVEGEQYLRREREVGQFRRVVQLPSEVVADNVDATCADGLLTIVLPKRTPAVASRITIK